MWSLRGKLGGCGGAQSASLPSAFKLAPPCPVSHATAAVPMTLPQVPARSSPPFYANPHGASPSPLLLGAVMAGEDGRTCTLYIAVLVCAHTPSLSECRLAQNYCTAAAS